jgi:tetratricopeptide (TPR) repeat protein
VDFRRNAGALLLELHDLDAALVEAQEGHRLAPLDQGLRDLLARIDLAMDRPVQALRRLTSVAEPGPAARLTVTEAYLRAGQLPAARNALTRISEDQSPRALLLRARVALAGGKPYAALREIGALTQRGGPVEAEAHLLRGLVALATADTAEAAHSFRAAVARDPLQAEALVELGRLRRQAADAAGARSFLEQAVAASPHLRAPRLELAELLAQLGDLPAAQLHFEEALVLDPGSEPALLGRAKAAVELDARGADTYLQALSARGQRAASEVLSARLLMQRGEHLKAATQLERPARRPGPLQAESALWLAQSLLRLNNLAAAELAFERAAELKVHLCESHLGLSQIDLRRGRVGTALLHASAAKEQLAGRIVPLALRTAIKLQLAQCHRQGESMGAAIVELQDVLELDRQSFEAHLLLGEIYASLGKRARAVQHLASAVKLNDKSKEARDELLRLCRGRELAGCPLE